MKFLLILRGTLDKALIFFQPVELCAFLMFSLLKVSPYLKGGGGQVFDKIQYDNQYLISNGICFVLKISLLGRS